MFSGFNLFSFLLLLLIPHVCALSGTFNSPPSAGKAGDFDGNVLYKDGDQLNISFTVDVPVFDVVLWQNGCRTNLMIKENTTETEFIWTVSVKDMPIPIRNYDNELFGDVAYLGVLDKNGGPYMTSHYFNLSDPNGVRSPVPTTTKAQPSSTSTTTSQPSSSSSQPTSTAAVPATTPAASTSGTPAPAAATGLSAGAAAGVAIGVILGLALGSVAAALLILRKRKRSSNMPPIPPQPGSYEAGDGMAAMKARIFHSPSNASSTRSTYKAPFSSVPSPAGTSPAPAYYPHRPSELSPEHVRHEVPAESFPVHEMPNYPSR